MSNTTDPGYPNPIQLVADALPPRSMLSVYTPSTPGEHWEVAIVYVTPNGLKTARGRAASLPGALEIALEAIMSAAGVIPPTSST